MWPLKSLALLNLSTVSSFSEYINTIFKITISHHRQKVISKNKVYNTDDVQSHGFDRTIHSPNLFTFKKMSHLNIYPFVTFFSSSFVYKFPLTFFVHTCMYSRPIEEEEKEEEEEEEEEEEGRRKKEEEGEGEEEEETTTPVWVLLLKLNEWNLSYLIIIISAFVWRFLPEDIKRCCLLLR